MVKNWFPKMGDLPWSPIIALTFTLLALAFTVWVGKKITTILFQTRSTYDEIHILPLMLVELITGKKHR